MIDKKTTTEAWKEALRLVINNGVDFMDENNRVCRESFNLLIRIENPKDDIKNPIKILNTFKHWKYPPYEEIAQVMLTSKTSPDYAYSYGSRIFNFADKKDQINDYIIPLLKENPNSRRATITIWDPIEDSNVINRDVPGLIMIDFKLRQNKLNAVAVIRSNDLFFGWPANIYQLYELQCYIAKKLKCEMGNLDTFSISAHIFSDQFEYIKKILEE